MQFSKKLSDKFLTTKTPIVLKNYVSEWPLTKIAKNSITDGADYLLDFYNDTPYVVLVGEIEQRIFIMKIFQDLISNHYSLAWTT